MIIETVRVRHYRHLCGKNLRGFLGYPTAIGTVYLYILFYDCNSNASACVIDTVLLGIEAVVFIIETGRACTETLFWVLNNFGCCCRNDYTCY